MTRKWLTGGALLVAFAAAALTLVSVGSAGSSADPLEAAWIYVGPHNDGGWSQAHDNGRLYVQKKLGSKVKTTYKESVPEGPAVTQVIEGLIRDGNKIIFATSFGYQGAMAAAAKKYPDIKFEMATGTQVLPNMAEYFGAGEDSIYLSGMAAGAATKKNLIGYVVPFPIPEVIRHANAFALGAQAINPKAKVRLVWTKSWFDLKKERQAAESLVAAGADVLGQNVDSPAAGQYAQEKGIPWVGYDSDASKFAKDVWLTAAVYDWGPYYLKKTKGVIDGTWKTGFYYGSIKDGFTDITPFGKLVSQKTRKAIMAKRALFIKTTKPGMAGIYFTGPLYDQNGKIAVPKGKRLTVKDLYAQNWLVKGIIGSPKG